MITEVTVRVRPAPAARRYEAWVAADFASGRELVRALAQADALPDVIRLSDEAETRVSLGLAGDRRRQAGAARRLPAAAPPQRRLPGDLRLGGRARSRSTAAGRSRAPLLRRGGAVPLGEAPGRAWERGRFDGPYLRDELMDLGYFVETLETSHTWSRLDDALPRRSAARSTRALRDQGTPGIVMCHLSHAYRDGASLYFTFVARARAGEEIEQWRAVKTAACEAIVAAGAHDHPPPRGRPRPRALHGRRGRRDSASRRCGRSRSASTRPGS